MIVGCLQLPYLMDVEERIAYCESLMVKEEFDLLVLPAAWSEDGHDSNDKHAIGHAAASAEKFQRYICELSARKHATIVAGVIEAVRKRTFQCAIVASLGALSGRYIKNHLSTNETRFFRPGKLYFGRPCGAHYGFGVVFDSELLTQPHYGPLAWSGANLGIVVGASKNAEMASIVQLRARQCGTTLLYANACGTPTLSSEPFAGRSGIVSPLGNWLAHAENAPVFVQCELPSGVKSWPSTYDPRTVKKFTEYGKECGFDEPPYSKWWW